VKQLKLNFLLQKSNPLIQECRNNIEHYNTHNNRIHLKELWVQNNMVGYGELVGKRATALITILNIYDSSYSCDLIFKMMDWWSYTIELYFVQLLVA
jgi:hypothetical protein